MISLGIDIGSSAIKLIEVQSTRTDYKIYRYQAYKLDPNPQADNEIQIIETLKQIAKDYAGKEYRCVLGINDSLISQRHVNFPFKERFKIFKSLAFELEDDLPFDQYETFYDAKVKRFVGGGAEVLASAVPKHRIEKIYGAAKDSGLQISHVVPNGISLYNLFSDFNAGPIQFKEPITIESAEGDETEVEAPATHKGQPIHQAQAILELGQNSSILLIKTDQFIVETRFIDWGLKDAANTHARKQSLHFSEAHQELLAHGEILINENIATKEKIALSDSLVASLENLIRPLKFHFVEIEKNNPVQIKQILITGGASLVKNIAPYLTQKIELPVEPIQFLVRNAKSIVNHNEYEGRTAGVALGLALEGLKSSTNPPSNFLQGDMTPSSEGMSKALSKWSYTVGLLAAAFVLFFVYAVVRNGLSQSMANKAHSEMKKQIELVMKVKGRKAGLRQANKFIKEKTGAQKQVQLTKDLVDLNSSMDVLNAISQSVPKRKPSNYEVKRLIVENSNITIEGEAQSSAISQIEKSLKSLSGGNIKSIRSGFSARAGWTSFGFTFKVDRKASL